MAFLRINSDVHLSISSMQFSGLPSGTTIFLSLLAALVLLSAIRAALLYRRPQASRIGQQQKMVIGQQQQQENSAKSERGDANSPSIKPRTSWGWGLLTWESLPTLPVSLKMPEDVKRRGVGLSGSQKPGQQWQQPRRGPIFERPVPAIYQTDVPASMAKMIMSRHTFRKPTLRPPPRSASPGPQVQITRRPPSMV